MMKRLPFDEKDYKALCMLVVYAVLFVCATLLVGCVAGLGVRVFMLASGLGANSQ